jgi:hypothetical protein
MQAKQVLVMILFMFLKVLFSDNFPFVYQAKQGDVATTGQLLQLVAAPNSTIQANRRTWVLVLHAHLVAGHLESAMAIFRHMCSLFSSEELGGLPLTFTSADTSAKYRELGEWMGVHEEREETEEKNGLITAATMLLRSLIQHYQLDVAMHLFSRLRGVQWVPPPLVASTPSIMNAVAQDTMNLFHNSRRFGYFGSNSALANAPQPGLSQTLARPDPRAQIALRDRLITTLNMFPATLPMLPTLRAFHVMLRALAFAERADDCCNLVTGGLFIFVRTGQQLKLSSWRLRTIAPLADTLPVLAWHGCLSELDQCLTLCQQLGLKVGRVIGKRIIRARIKRDDIISGRELMHKLQADLGLQLSLADRQELKTDISKVAQRLAYKERQTEALAVGADVTAVPAQDANDARLESDDDSGDIEDADEAAQDDATAEMQIAQRTVLGDSEPNLTSSSEPRLEERQPWEED